MTEEYLDDPQEESTGAATEASDPIETSMEAPMEAPAEGSMEAVPPAGEPPVESSEEAPVVAEAPAVEAAAPTGPEMKWYIIHTYSGFENKVRESLKTRADAFGFAHQVGEVLIPTEEVVEVRNGKKVTSKRLLYPGYVLVQLSMDENLWHAVKDTPRVTGFVGGGKDPVPLTADEVNSVLYRQTTAADRPRPKLSFEKGETVRINDGPFANFTGKVDDINPERDTLRVLVTIFGRSTPVELDFLQVEKAN
jgi:transcriptional antiterminator NusG